MTAKPLQARALGQRDEQIGRVVRDSAREERVG